MKNKGKLLLIPAAILLLGGCSPTAKTNIPRGHDIVDPTDANARSAFFAKVSKDIANTYEKANEGFKIEGAFGFDEFSFSDGNDYVKVTDAGMDFTIAVANYNKGYNNVQAMAEISDLSFKLEYKMNNKNKTLKVSGVDISAYYSEGNIYLDLSDKDLKNAVYSVIDLAYEDSSSEYVKKFKAQADKYLTKLVVKNNRTVDEIKEYVLPTENYKISNDDVLELASRLNKAFDYVLKDDSLKNLVTLSEDKNSQSAAIRVALASNPVNIDNMNLSGNMAALLSFDKDGIMDNIGLAGNVRVVDGRSKEVLEVKKANFAVSFEFGKNSVKLPSFSGYTDFPN